MESLFSRTAKLPQISLEAPGHYIGGDTAEAIKSGIVYGTVGLVDACSTEFSKNLEAPAV